MSDQQNTDYFNQVIPYMHHNEEAYLGHEENGEDEEDEAPELEEDEENEAPELEDSYYPQHETVADILQSLYHQPQIKENNAFSKEDVIEFGIDFYESIHTRNLKLNQKIYQFIYNFSIQKWFAGDNLSNIEDIDEETASMISTQQTIDLINIITDILECYSDEQSKQEFGIYMSDVTKYLSKFTLWNFNNDLTIEDKLFLIALISAGLKLSDVTILEKLFCCRYYKDRLLTEVAGLNFFEAIMINSCSNYLKYCLECKIITLEEIFKQNEEGYSFYHYSVVNSHANVKFLMENYPECRDELNRPLNGTKFTPFMIGCEIGAMSLLTLMDVVDKNEFQRCFYGDETCLSLTSRKNATLFLQLLDSELNDEKFLKRKINGKSLFQISLENPESVCHMLEKNLVSKEELEDKNSSIFISISKNFNASKKILELDLDPIIFKNGMEVIFRSKNFDIFLKSDKITIDILDTEPPFLISTLKNGTLTRLDVMGSSIEILLINLKKLLESEKFTKEMFTKSIDLKSISNNIVMNTLIESPYFDETFIKANLNVFPNHYLVIDIYSKIISEDKIFESLLEDNNFIRASTELGIESFKKVSKKLNSVIIANHKLITYLLNNDLFDPFKILIENNDLAVNLISETEYEIVCSDKKYLKYLEEVLKCDKFQGEYLKENNIREKILNYVIDKGGYIIKMVLDKLYTDKDRPDITDRIFEIFICSMKMGIDSVKATESLEWFHEKVFNMVDKNGNNFLHHLLKVADDNFGLALLNYYKSKININLINTQNEYFKNCLYVAAESSCKYVSFLLENNFVNKESFSQKDENNYTTFFKIVSLDNQELLKSSMKFIDKEIFDTKLNDNRSIFSFIQNTDSKEKFLKDDTLSLLIDSKYFTKESIFINEKILLDGVKDIELPIIIKLVRYERVKTVKKIIEKLDDEMIFDLEDELGNSILVCSHENAELFRYLLNHKFMTKNILEKKSKKHYNVLAVLTNKIAQPTHDLVPTADLMREVLNKDICTKDFIERDVNGNDIINICTDLGELLKIFFDLDDTKISEEFVNSHKINGNTMIIELLKQNRLVSQENVELIDRFILSRFFDARNLFQINKNNDFKPGYLFSNYISQDLVGIDKDALLKLIDKITDIEENELLEKLTYPDEDMNFLKCITVYKEDRFLKILLDKLADKNVQLDKIRTVLVSVIRSCFSQPKILRVFAESVFFTESLLKETNRFGHSLFLNLVFYLSVDDIETSGVLDPKFILESDVRYKGDYDGDRLPMAFCDKYIDKFNLLIDKKIIDEKSIQLKNNLGETALLKAVKKGAHLIAKTILNRLFCQSCVLHQDIDEKNLFHYIFSDRKLISVYFDTLIQKDISPLCYIAKDIKGKTPLHYLVENSTVTQFDTFLNKIYSGSIFEVKDFDGNTIFLQACETRHDLLNSFYSNPEFTALHISARDNNQNSVFYKLKDSPDNLAKLLKKYDLDDKLLYKLHSDKGSVLIDMAVSYPDSFKVVMDSLTELNFVVLDSRYDDKKSLAHVCFENGTKSLKILLEANIDIEYLLLEYSNCFGIESPFILACQFNPEAVRVLCDSYYKYLVPAMVLELDVSERSKLAHFVALECQPLALCYLIKSGLVPDDIWNIPYSSGYKIINHIKIGNPQIDTLDQFLELEFVHEVNELTDVEEEKCNICTDYKAKVCFEAGNCDHKLCVSCALRSKTCPFCRAHILRKYIDRSGNAPHTEKDTSKTETAQIVELEEVGDNQHERFSPDIIEEDDVIYI